MKLKYCPACAAVLTKHSDTKYVCSNQHIYWNSPRATVTIILLKANQALFSKRGIEPKKGLYDFPGGFVNFGEDPLTAIKRELMEETGLEAIELELLSSAAQSYEENITVCDFIFVSRTWTGEIVAQDDVAELEWKPISFIESSNFAWVYPNLVQKLQSFINTLQ